MEKFIKRIYQYLIIKHSGLFDENYYLVNNPDVRENGLNPLMHFIQWGWKEGRDPNSNFDTNWYLNKNRDLQKAGINPLYHYLKFGKRKGVQTQRIRRKKINVEPGNFTKKNKKRLIIHIGMPKTGSTSLQKFLFDYYDDLFSLGICYPKHLHLHNIKFYPIFFENPFEYIDLRKRYSSKDVARIKHEEYKNEWKVAFNNNDYQDLIISSENLYLWPEEQINEFNKFIKGCFEKVKIICYIREPISYLRSQIQQDIKSGRIVEKNLDKLVKNYSSACRYSKYLKRWIEVFGEHSVELINFSNKYLIDGDLIQDFFYRISYKNISKNLGDTKKANVSLDSDIISFLYFFNQKYPMYIDRNINPQRGLKVHQDYWVNILKRVKSNNKKNQLIISDQLKDELNEEILFVNKFLNPETKFELLKHDGHHANDFTLEEVDLDLCIDIINECFKEIEDLLSKVNNLG